MEDQYRNLCAAYHNRLSSAIETVEQIDPALYPTLYGYMGGGMERRLIQFIQIIASIPVYPEIDEDGNAPVAISHRQLVKRFGGCIQTWNHYLTLWAAWGLIAKVKPKADHPSKHERQLLRRAEELRRYPETRYIIPPYTTQLLEQAEYRAHQWKKAKVSIGSMTKATLIRVYGQGMANQAYDDRRQISAQAQRAQEALQAAILRQLTERPYATRKTVEAVVKAQGIPPAQARAAWGRCLTGILRQHGLTYSRPTRAEVDLWNLPSQEYIIRQRTKV